MIWFFVVSIKVATMGIWGHKKKQASVIFDKVWAKKLTCQKTRKTCLGKRSLTFTKFCLIIVYFSKIEKSKYFAFLEAPNCYHTYRRDQ